MKKINGKRALSLVAGAIAAANLSLGAVNAERELEIGNTNFVCNTRGVCSLDGEILLPVKAVGCVVFPNTDTLGVTWGKIKRSFLDAGVLLFRNANKYIIIANRQLYCFLDDGILEAKHFTNVAYLIYRGQNGKDLEYISINAYPDVTERVVEKLNEVIWQWRGGVRPAAGTRRGLAEKKETQGGAASYEKEARDLGLWQELRREIEEREDRSKVIEREEFGETAETNDDMLLRIFSYITKIID